MAKLRLAAARAGSELVPTRRTLLDRLRNLDDQESWHEFFDTYWKLLYCAAIKAGLSDAEAEDAVQETVIGVARNMPGFRYEPRHCSAERHSREGSNSKYASSPPARVDIQGSRPEL